MSDIVVRLRNVGIGNYQGRWQDMWEAAAEIERLRAALQEIWDLRSATSAYPGRTTLEIARRALEEGSQ